MIWVLRLKDNVLTNIFAYIITLCMDYHMWGAVLEAHRNLKQNRNNR